MKCICNIFKFFCKKDNKGNSIDYRGFKKIALKDIDNLLEFLNEDINDNNKTKFHYRMLQTFGVIRLLIDNGELNHISCVNQKKYRKYANCYLHMDEKNTADSFIYLQTKKCKKIKKSFSEVKTDLNAIRDAIRREEELAREKTIRKSSK